MTNNTIYGINGPVVTVKNTKDFSMQEMVRVGHNRLIGEVIGIDSDMTTIQVYEGTTGLRPGEPVVGTNAPLSVTLGPGIISNIFDGIERPLKDIEKQSGAFIGIGGNITSLDEKRLWSVHFTVNVGDRVSAGAIFATVPETQSVEHRSMIPPTVSGTITKIKPDGEYTITEPLLTVTDDKGHEHEVCLAQKWPIREARPIEKRLPCNVPLITGQRVIDTVMPIAKGGTAAIPGGFGTGKTMTQHQLAKWCDADIIIYVGCGERGNEMTQVLDEFGDLVDPRTGRKLTDRTVLIANTSNMPVAAREASIYTGITLAEYYRDMGYDVAMMADSTSRWAEALREISGRLEEMPAEEGYPSYLPSRLSQFYERAGRVETLNNAQGSISIIGAVSPQGSDFSEPVTQNTKRFTRVFWALDKSLAYARHYPAINWNTGYSEYVTDLESYYTKNVADDFMELRSKLCALLREENDLMEIVKLIGADVLPSSQKLVIDIARVIRVGFLQQNAYHSEDTYVPLKKQYLMMKTILHLYNRSLQVVNSGKSLTYIKDSGIYEKLIKMKYDIPNNKLELFDDYIKDIDSVIDAIL